MSTIFIKFGEPKKNRTIKRIDILKPLHDCLDILLRRLVADWNNYGDDRKDLNCEEMMTSFGLEPQYRKHEFFVGLIDKLIKDGYAELINSRSFDSKISQYQKNTIITITGYYFILKQGGYTKERRNRLISEIPKTYWWAIAIFTFLIGLFSDILKERLKQKSPAPSSKSAEIVPGASDSSLARHFGSDSIKH